MVTSFLKFNIFKNHFSGLLILTKKDFFFNSNITVGIGLSENQPLLGSIHNLVLGSDLEGQYLAAIIL